ncbi:MAG TPA: hypothetical protein VF211_01215 [Burkholderiales bacterium]
MSAAATAAGYLYASGRLRGKGAREQEQGAEQAKPQRGAPRRESAAIKKPVRVAALPPREPEAPQPPKRVPRIQYRVRRWRPSQNPDE